MWTTEIFIKGAIPVFRGVLLYSHICLAIWKTLPGNAGEQHRNTACAYNKVWELWNWCCSCTDCAWVYWRFWKILIVHLMWSYSLLVCICVWMCCVSEWLSQQTCDYCMYMGEGYLWHSLFALPNPFSCEMEKTIVKPKLRTFQFRCLSRQSHIRTIQHWATETSKGTFSVTIHG